jgi:signal transduction histidine kinase/DNA-binding response OmpR family regulator
MSAARPRLVPFRAWSLASKLSGIVMFTTLVGVLLSYITFAIIEYQVTVGDARGHITSLARVIAANSGAAVAFQDTDAAEDALAILHDKPEIVSASVVPLSGNALAHYERRMTPDPVSNAWLADGILAAMRIAVAEPVRVNGEVVGNLALAADLATVWRGLATKLMLSAGAVGGVLVLVALPLSRRLQRLNSEPVIELSSAARSITREGDYTIRARRHGDDEVGTLIDCFNAILDRIQARDAEIEGHNRMLESRVGERTRDLERIRERLVMALDASNLALWDCNGETGEVYVSDAEPLRGGGGGVTVDPSVGTILESVHSEDRPRFSETFGATLRGEMEVIDIETRMRRDDGDWQWIHLIGHIVERSQAGRVLRVIGTLENATARRKNRAELQRAKEAAEAASRAKSQFLANMSHEIRTPMNGVLGVTEVLLDAPISERQRELALTLERPPEHLVRVINDILDFSKIEAGRMTLEHTPFDLCSAIEDAVQVFAAQAHAKGLELACAVAHGVPARVIGDPVRLRQILTNLVGNAIKFTRTGEIIVSVNVAEGTGASVRLAFDGRDTGVGIAPEAQARIFDAFSQADETTTRRFGGMGLGLSIVRQLAEPMGGGVSVESTRGAGSTFRFTVLADIDPEAPGAPRESRILRRVMVVDDNTTNRQILEHQCASAGLAVTSAADGPSALQALKSARGLPDLVILDDRMPGMGGLDVLRAIRTDTNRDLAAVRVVVLSAGEDQPPPAEASRLAIDAWLRKPVRRADLLRCIAPSRAHVSQATPPGNGNAPEPGLGADILLVKDNPVNQLVANQMLAALGCRVTFAKDGYEYLTALEQRAFDCVLMDCQMPGMDGYTATRRWRHRESTSGRPRQHIVALTANAVGGDRERCIAAGMDDYLPKPFQRDQLRALIAEHLPRQRDALGMAEQGTDAAKPLAPPSPTNTLAGSSHRNHHAEV